MELITLGLLVALILLLIFITRIYDSITANNIKKQLDIELEKEKQATIIKEQKDYEQKFSQDKNALILEYRRLQENLIKNYKTKEAQLATEYQEKLQELEDLKTQHAKEYTQQQQSFKEERQRWHIQQHYTDQKEQIYNNAIKGLNELIKKQCLAYPALAAVMADVLTAHYAKSAYILEKKKRPALEEAKRIRELQVETKAILTEKKNLEYELAYIRKLFPNIDDIFDTGFTAENFELETEEHTDKVRLFLSPEEYTQLSISERNQLALDRYITSRKSKWEIGRDFELYIGYLCEQHGWRVQYSGILDKLEDLGRDLIIQKDLTTVIIQCKNWAQSKTIHEKHIFQLYGTVILYKLEHPMETVKGVFISTTQLSNVAKDVAQYLDIKTIHKEMQEFPRIKCNINSSTNEKIYHLPFDQQYERTLIDSSNGEFYALTVTEAEEKGFRRAFKHFLTNN